MENRIGKIMLLTVIKANNNDKENSFLAGFQENINKKNACKNHTKIFFYPFIAGGYGWMFPKKDSLNVGIAVNMNSLKENGLKTHMPDLKASL